MFDFGTTFLHLATVLSQPLLGSRLPPGGHVIVLVPTAGVVGRPLEWEFTQLLSDVINKSSDVTVTCNLWHMTEACSDVTGWFSDVISNSSNEVATHFVFVHPLASLSELGESRDIVHERFEETAVSTRGVTFNL